jgi:hypothetical protein
MNSALTDSGVAEEVHEVRPPPRVAAITPRPKLARC